MRQLPTIATPRLVLRPFRLSDAARVTQLAGDREVADTTLVIPYPYPAGAAEAWIATHEGDWTRHEGASFAITEADEGVVGAISLRIELPHRRAELGYWIGRPYWGQGFATEAALAVICFGFETVAAQRIYAQHFTRNPASGRVLEKAGMQREGMLRRHVYRWGVPEDVAVWAVIAPPQ
jgi:[ribosomal protein S5]-alanine N-acetyltransferase